jgi:hypothetical protein
VPRNRMRHGPKTGAPFSHDAFARADRASAGETCRVFDPRATEQVARGRGRGICRKAVAVGRVSMNPISQLV